MTILKYKTAITYGDGTKEIEEHSREFATKAEAEECECIFYNGDFGGLICYDFNIIEV